jgi:hypothetical protein
MSWYIMTQVVEAEEVVVAQVMNLASAILWVPSLVTMMEAGEVFHLLNQTLVQNQIPHCIVNVKILEILS